MKDSLAERLDSLVDSIGAMQTQFTSFQSYVSTQFERLIQRQEELTKEMVDLRSNATQSVALERDGEPSSPVCII